MKRLFVLAVLGILVGCGEASLAPKASKAPAVRCDRGWMNVVYGSAQASGLLEHSTVTSEGAVLVVDRQVFDRTSFADKTKIAVAVDCAAAGDGKHINAVRFRSSLHGPDLALFEAADLLEARRRQFGTVRSD